MKQNAKTIGNLLFGLLIVGGIAFFFYSKSGKSLPKGELAPDFEAELIDGTPFKLSDLRGKYVILDFWGSWCRPCRLENPRLASIYNKYKGKSFRDADGLEVVTVAMEKQDGAWERAAEMDGFTWKYQIVEQTMFVSLSGIARKYGVTEIPSKFLIDPDGNLREEKSLALIDNYLERNLP